MKEYLANLRVLVRVTDDMDQRAAEAHALQLAKCIAVEHPELVSVYARNVEPYHPMPKWQRNYHELREKVGGDDQAREHLAVQMRLIAMHLDEKCLPFVLGISEPLIKGINTEDITNGDHSVDFEITLSHPLGG